MTGKGQDLLISAQKDEGLLARNTAIFAGVLWAISRR
jgi:hypothetical protein